MIKDKLHQVNEKIEANYQITREIESEIVKCCEIETEYAVCVRIVIKSTAIFSCQVGFFKHYTYTTLYKK